MAAQRTAAPRTNAHALDYSNRRSTDHGDVGGDRIPSKAQEEDDNTKAAYGIDRLRSCYITTMNLPTEVPARDYALCRWIVARIDWCLEIRGRWTQAERVRLYRMRKKWIHRASGNDVLFNLRGWSQRSTHSVLTSYQQDRREAQQVANLIKGVRRIIGVDD